MCVLDLNKVTRSILFFHLLFSVELESSARFLGARKSSVKFYTLCCHFDDV